MNGKVYTLQDLKDLCEVATQEYNNGWWGIVVPEYLYNEIQNKIKSQKATKETKRLSKLFAINIIINDELVQRNGGHCMFVDEDFGRIILNSQAMPYEIYEAWINRLY